MSIYNYYTYAQLISFPLSLIMTEVQLKRCALLLVFTSNCIKLLFEMFTNHPLMCGWDFANLKFRTHSLAKLRRITQNTIPWPSPFLFWVEIESHEYSVYYLPSHFSAVQIQFPQAQTLRRKIKCSLILYWEINNVFHISLNQVIHYTKAKVWENKKCCWNTSCRWIFPQNFPVLLKVYYTSRETWQ